MKQDIIYNNPLNEYNYGSGDQYDKSEVLQGIFDQIDPTDYAGVFKQLHTRLRSAFSTFFDANIANWKITRSLDEAMKSIQESLNTGMVNSITTVTTHFQKWYPLKKDGMLRMWEQCNQRLKADQKKFMDKFLHSNAFENSFKVMFTETIPGVLAALYLTIYCSVNEDVI